jgi:DNA-directed RNA polymerase subunit F
MKNIIYTIEPELHADLKAICAKQRKTMSSVVVDLIREFVQKENENDTKRLSRKSRAG